MNNQLLIFAAILSGVAALLHVGCITFGAPWYRFFGAGERMASLAEAGSWRPALITSGVVLVFAIWPLYAFSGAGVVPVLPFLRFALCVIAGAYLLRGIAGFAFFAFAPGGNGRTFWAWSSAICLAIGALHLVGIWHAWPYLSHVSA